MFPERLSSAIKIFTGIVGMDPVDFQRLGQKTTRTMTLPEAIAKPEEL